MKSFLKHTTLKHLTKLQKHFRMTLYNDFFLFASLIFSQHLKHYLTVCIRTPNTENDAKRQLSWCYICCPVLICPHQSFLPILTVNLQSHTNAKRQLLPSIWSVCCYPPPTIARSLCGLLSFQSENYFTMCST